MEVAEDLLYQANTGLVVVDDQHLLQHGLLRQLDLGVFIGDFQYEMQGESTSFSGLALYGQIPAHQLGQALGDGQSQPRTAVFAGGGRVGLGKAFENLLQLFLPDTDAGVLYFYSELDKGFPLVLVAAATLPDRNEDLPIGREFDGISQQIDH